MKRIFTAALIAIALGIDSGPDRVEAAGDGAPAGVTLERAAISSVAGLRITGSTAAETGVMLRAPYLRGSRTRRGRGDFDTVLTRLASPGTKVSEGDIVAVFDNENMRTRIDDLAADRVEAEGKLSRLIADQDAEREAHDQKIRVAQAQVRTAQLDLKTVSVRSAIEAQQFRLTLEEAKATLKALQEQRRYVVQGQAAEMRSARLELNQAALELRRAQTNLERLIVRAPIDGLTVAQEIYRGGEMGQVRAGDQLHPGQPYLRIVNPGSMIVEGTTNQVDVRHLRIGDPAQILLDAYPDLRLEGRVRSIGAIAASSGWRAGYVAEVPVTFDILGSDPRVIPSLTASAEMLSDSD